MRIVVDGVFAGYVPVIGDNPNKLAGNDMKIVGNGEVRIVVNQRNCRFPKVGRNTERSRSAVGAPARRAWRSDVRGRGNGQYRQRRASCRVANDGGICKTPVTIDRDETLRPCPFIDRCAWIGHAVAHRRGPTARWARGLGTVDHARSRLGHPQ